MNSVPGDELKKLKERISAEDILENIYHSIIVTDLEGTIIYWNKGGEELFGYSKEEIIGRKASILYPEKRREEFEEELGNLKDGEMMTGQWLGQRKDGSWIWVDIRTKLYEKEDGKFVGIIGSACDIEPQKKFEKQLKESRALAKAVLETTVDGIITINSEGIIQSYNKAAENIFGYKEEEVLGENVSMLMPNPHRENHDQYINSYLETGEKQIIGKGREVRGKRKDGSTFPMELAVSEVRCGNGIIFSGIVKDISNRRSLEKEIIEIGENERRRIGQELHDDLGQTLTAIALMSQNLAKRMESNGIPGAGELKDITEMIKEADSYARTLSHSLMPIDLERGGLEHALEQLCDRAEKLFNVKCNFTEKGDALIKRQSTAFNLYRIAQESISNAVKHGKASQVDILLNREGNNFRLHIEDNGVGFSNTAGNEKIEEKGMGIHTMRYRAHISGGELNITKSENGNTLIECIINNYDYSTNSND